jgi:hypothetical protein
MTEQEIQVIEIDLYGYVNDKGQKVYTPNLEFAQIMATKYGTTHVYIEKK